MLATRRSNKGFTLIEILIVVIILGILAAIVIPQFSSASNDARKSSLQTTTQTLRSQIALFKLQHKDELPDLVTNWDPLIKKTAEDGTVSATGAYGPYMQDVPKNAINGNTNVVNGDGTAASGTACAYLYDYASGNGTGKIWGTDTDGKTLVP